MLPRQAARVADRDHAPLAGRCRQSLCLCPYRAWTLRARPAEVLFTDCTKSITLERRVVRSSFGEYRYSQLGVVCRNGLRSGVRWVGGHPLRCLHALTKFILSQFRSNTTVLRLQTNRYRDLRGHPPNVGQRR